MNIERWSSTATTIEVTSVFADGCRDLVFHNEPGGRWSWRISPLSISPLQVRCVPGQQFVGYRLPPGGKIDSDALAARLVGIDDDDISGALAESSCASQTCMDVLALAVEGHRTVSDFARYLGTSERTLQRRVSCETGMPLSYWTALVRARRAAAALAGDAPLVQVASDAGFADQSHMTRELRRWFAAPPAVLRASPETLAAIGGPHIR